MVFLMIQPFTYDFPCADIYAMLTPDLLHQVIKGMFKDHLVAWTENYLAEMHGEARKDVIMDDIDRR
jgi:predicted membrane-bound dolichyl-phosphate-mannose-protein mannosyltransferase